MFFNTHFDHLSNRARTESARLLRERVGKVGKGTAVVVTGDFNAGEGSEPYRALFGKKGDEASPLRDAYRAAHPKKGEQEGTYSGFRAGARKGARIDWIASVM